jgi:hypothetical protein
MTAALAAQAETVRIRIPTSPLSLHQVINRAAGERGLGLGHMAVNEVAADLGKSTRFE